MSTLVDQLRVEGVVLNETCHDGACVLADHTHEEATIGILLDGSVAERRDGLVYVQTGGDVFVRRRGVRHANQFLVDGARSLFVEFEPDDPRAKLLGASDALALPKLSAAGRALATAFRRRSPRELAARIDALVSDVAKVHRSPRPAWLVAARERLAASYEAPPSLRELAEAANVHPVHFAQAFRAHYGVTVGAFVRSHRVFQAVSLLHRGDELADVSTACGFADQSHMTRLIRAQRGLPPGKLKKRFAAPP